jgi:hypothetical protein
MRIFLIPLLLAVLLIVALLFLSVPPHADETAQTGASVRTLQKL